MLEPTADAPSWDKVRATARRHGVDLSECDTVDDALALLKRKGIAMEDDENRDRIRRRLTALTFKELAHLSRNLGLDPSGFPRKRDLIEGLLAFEGIETVFEEEQEEDEEPGPEAAREAEEGAEGKGESEEVAPPEPIIPDLVDLQPLTDLFEDLRTLMVASRPNLVVGLAREAAARGEEILLEYLGAVWRLAVEGTQQVLKQIGDEGEAAEAAGNVARLLARAEDVLADGSYFGQSNLLTELHGAVIALNFLDLEETMRSLSAITDEVAGVAALGANVDEALSLLHQAKEMLEAGEGKGEALRLAEQARVAAKEARAKRLQELQEGIQKVLKRIDAARLEGLEFFEPAALIARAKRLIADGEYTVAASMIALANKRLDAQTRLRSLRGTKAAEAAEAAGGAEEAEVPASTPPDDQEAKRTEALKLKTVVTKTWRLIEQAEAKGQDVTRPKEFVRQAIVRAKEGGYPEAFELMRKAAEGLRRLHAEANEG